MFRLLSKVVLKLLGWKITGNNHSDITKKILVAAPHTSNWDFPLGIMVRSVIQDDIKYIGKDSLFKPPLGWIFSKMGGIGVDRKKSNNFVEAVVKKIKSSDDLSILFAAEGSRKKVAKFKTGFYHVARLAEVPILPIVLDYEHKEFKFLDLVWATDNAESDMAHIEGLFKGVKGYHPEQSFYYPN